MVEVIPDGPGAVAGLQQGDVIGKFQGKSISSAYQLLNALAETTPGTKVTVTVLRNNKESQVAATHVNNGQQFSKLVGEAIKTGTVLLLIRDSQSGQTVYLQIPIG